MTLTPHSEKNFSTPMGETLIPQKAKKKYRELSNGMKKPAPLSPLVIASKTP